ncbi:hypothetical protein BT69DRAFT_1353860 [Atractiella rhizophila]|nr:hypothetical protein BT69DRAFT_1353860 [Atractiella rhizophila]
MKGSTIAAIFSLLAASVMATPAPADHTMNIDLEKRVDHFGDGTVFNTEVGLGACGDQNRNSDFIVALGGPLWDEFQANSGTTNPNLNKVCDRRINVQNPSTGKTITVTVKDKCPSCARDDLDFTPAPFASLFNGATTGRFDIKWNFLPA